MIELLLLGVMLGLATALTETPEDKGAGAPEGEDAAPAGDEEAPEGEKPPADEAGDKEWDAAVAAATTKHQAEVTRLTGALRRLQGERDQLREQLETKGDEGPPRREQRPAPPPEPTPIKPTGDSELDATLAALPRDEDGNVLMDGLAYSPKAAERLLRSEMVATRADKRVTEFLERQQQQADEQRERDLGEALVKTAEAYITELAGQALPKTFPEERRETFGRRAIQTAAGLFDAATERGEAMTDELVFKSCQQAVREERDYLSTPVTTQRADNEQYAQRYPVRPGGGAGTSPPLSLDKMTPTQRLEVARVARQRAEQRVAEDAERS